MFVSSNANQHSYFASSQLKEIGESMERLTSGKRINSASDNAANSAQISSATTQILESGAKISALGTTSDLLSTAESSMQSLSNTLQSMRSLLVAHATDTFNGSDKASLTSSIDSLQRVYEHTLEAATFNEQNLLKDGFSFSNNSLQMEFEIPALGLEEITSATSSPSGTVVSVNGVEQTQYEVQEIAIPKNLNQVDNSGVDFTDLPSDIEDADIVSLQNGEFVAVFSATSSGYGLYAQKFNQAGVANGTEFQISDGRGFLDGKNATVESLAGGGFAVGYSENSQAKVRIFSAAGAVTTTINIPSLNGDSDLSLSSNQSDQLFVTWTEQSGSNQLLRGAVYESDGSVIRDAFTIRSNSNPNSVEDRFGYYHSARISDDKFVVSWIQRFNISPRVHSIFAKVIGVESENDTATINIPSPRGSSDFSSLKVLGLEDDTALIAFGDEGPGGDAGDVLTRKINSAGELLGTGKLGPVARSQISIIQTPDNQLVYYENGVIRQEMKVYRDTATLSDGNYLDNVQLSRTDLANEFADVIAANADGVVMLMDKGLSIKRFSIDDGLSDGVYTLNAAGVTLSGTLSAPGDPTLAKLIESFEADANYDASLFTLSEANGNLEIQFNVSRDQVDAVLQGPDGNIGPVTELVGGTAPTFSIDLNSLGLDDSSYSLKVDDLLLVAESSPGTPKTPETLLAALQAADDYSGSGISLNIDGDELIVTVLQGDQPTEVSLSKTASGDMVSITLTAVDEALDRIAAETSKLGAIQNRISYSSEVLARKLAATRSYRSGIEDADFASEVSRLTMAQILQDANIKMQVQDNVSKQLVLSLLR